MGFYAIKKCRIASLFLWQTNSALKLNQTTPTPTSNYLQDLSWLLEWHSSQL